MNEGHPVILCVDDEKSILRALRRVFLEEPWKVLLMEDSTEALAALETHDVDLVLSDYRMPGMNGIEFLSRAREIRPDAVRVVLTGYADADAIVSALEAGEIYRYVNKPWNETELLDVVRKALEHGRLRRDRDERGTPSDADAGETAQALRLARRLIEDLPMAVVGVDAAGDVVLANPKARALGAHDSAPRGGVAGADVTSLRIDGQDVGFILQGPGATVLGRGPKARGSLSSPPPARVVLVDDEPSVLTALERLLKGEPFEVESFSDPAAALNRIRAEPPSVVLADYYMPGMDGVELFERVREIDSTIVRITLTGRPDVTVILDAVARGSVFRFLLKPWDEEEIRAALHDAVAHHGHLRENIERQRRLLDRVLSRV
jgi:DNA-binding NtrC family response regulator